MRNAVSARRKIGPCSRVATFEQDERVVIQDCSRFPQFGVVRVRLQNAIDRFVPEREQCRPCPGRRRSRLMLIVPCGKVVFARVEASVEYFVDGVHIIAGSMARHLNMGYDA